MSENNIVNIAVGKAGKQFTVEFLERYKDENATEKSRWVPSKKMYFDNLELALQEVREKSLLLVD